MFPHSSISALLSTTLLAFHGKKKSNNQYIKSKSLDSYMHVNKLFSAVNKFEGNEKATVMIDAENVRGKSGFALSHADLFEGVALWTERWNLTGRVSLVVDHGAVSSGYWLDEYGFSVVFAGSGQKADDVLARDVSFFSEYTESKLVIVVTADQELISRCHKASGKGHELQIMPPINFLTDLEQFGFVGRGTDNPILSLNALTGSSPAGNNSTETSPSLLDFNNVTSDIDEEIKLGAQLLEAEAQLKKRRGASNKSKRKIEKRINRLRFKLKAGGQSTLNRVISVLADGREQEEQNEILLQWSKIRQTSRRREQTGDRILLAEHFRRKLEQILEKKQQEIGESENDVSDDSSLSLPAKAHALYINSLLANATIASSTRRSRKNSRKSEMLDMIKSKSLSAADVVSKVPFEGYQRLLELGYEAVDLEAKSSDQTLRLVVVSDTHGFERTLTPNGSTLPDGDVLLHLGDFAVDGRKCREKLVQFDEWLAGQPHPTKIVLRGNHDPFKSTFPLSESIFVVEPTTIKLHNDKFSLSLIPYCSDRDIASMSLAECDIVASHVPPRNILDRCNSGGHAGSSMLHTIVRRGTKLPPRLWLCGHIHEGRGSIPIKFKGDQKTLVINASNANPGRARRIQYGPVVVDLDVGMDGKVNVRHMDDLKGVPSEITIEGLPTVKRKVEEGVGQLLLAIDLGLRTGISLFNDRGELLRYDFIHLSDVDELYEHAARLMMEWEDAANADCEETGERWQITCIALEGAEPSHYEAWTEAAMDTDLEIPEIISIRPDEWRSEFLVSKEQISGKKAKEAARLIARQVVSDYGVMDEHVGRFKTDAAESIVMGLFVARRLGWVKREPAVRRYSNGGVILPKTPALIS